MADSGLLDWVLWLANAILIGLALYIYKQTKSGDKTYRFFLSGFLIKIVSGVLFFLVFKYYYGFGDTFFYFKGASDLSKTITSDPVTYFRLLGSQSGSFAPDLSHFAEIIPYSRTYEEWFMLKLLSPIVFISFRSYLLTTLFVSLISFFGSWKLFRVFDDVLKGENTLLAFGCAFLIPSVLFWGSGILKDTITLAALNYLIYLAYFSFFKGRFSVRKIVLIMLMIYIIIGLKAYIFISFVPGLVLGLYLNFKNRIKSRVLQLVLGPFLFILLTGGTIYGLYSFTAQEGKYNAGNIESRVIGFHTWHRDVGGSTYDLGEVEFTPQGVARKIPAALNVTFFRPYPWEANNFFLLLGALESFLFFGIFVYAIVKSKLRILKILRNEPILFGGLIFCLVFGFVVGFTSYNFGALARYKIPISALSVFILFYVINKSSVKSTDKTEVFPQPFVEEKNTI